MFCKVVFIYYLMLCFFFFYNKNIIYVAMVSKLLLQGPAYNILVLENYMVSV